MHWEGKDPKGRWYDDDANERYGKCDRAYEGVGEAYPWSDVLLDLEGPDEGKRIVTPYLLTHERFGCIRFLPEPRGQRPKSRTVINP